MPIENLDSPELSHVCHQAHDLMRNVDGLTPHPPVKGLRPTSQDSFITPIIIITRFLGYLRYMITMKKLSVVK
jgi:hypothetical protein